MKRAITIIAAFVVAALLTVAAQATSHEEPLNGQQLHGTRVGQDEQSARPASLP